MGTVHCIACYATVVLALHFSTVQIWSQWRCGETDKSHLPTSWSIVVNALIVVIVVNALMH